MTGAPDQRGHHAHIGVAAGRDRLHQPARPPAPAPTRTAPTAPATSPRPPHRRQLPGHVVSWTAASDNNWVSYYDVYRDNAYLGRIAQGMFFLDHTPGASPTRRTASRRSTATATRRHHRVRPGARARPRRRRRHYRRLSGYTGSWTPRHRPGRIFDQTLSSSSSSTATASYASPAERHAYFAMGPNEGKANVSVDGTTDTLDLYAPDALTTRPRCDRRLAGLRHAHDDDHPDRHDNAKSSGDVVYVDGLRSRSRRTATTDDAAFSYAGTGWSTACEPASGLLHGDLHTRRAPGRPPPSRSTRASQAHRRLLRELRRGRHLRRRQLRRADRHSTATAARPDPRVLCDRSFADGGTHTVKVIVDGTKNLESTGTTSLRRRLLTDNGGTAVGRRLRLHRPVAATPRSPVPAGGPGRLGTAADASGNGHTATVHGGVTFGSPAPSRATRSRGRRARRLQRLARRRQPSALQGADGSIEAWVRTTDADSGLPRDRDQVVRLRVVPAQRRARHLRLGAGPSRLRRRVADGKWHHVVETFHPAAGATRLYVDGSAR